MSKMNLLLISLLILVPICNKPPSPPKSLEFNERCLNHIDGRFERRAVDYLVRISYLDDHTCQRLEILKGDKVVYSEEGIDNHYDLGNEWNDHRGRYLMHLTGHGTQLVISRWTGGAHCCNSLLIFDVKGEFRKIGDIYGGNYYLEIVDLDHDGKPEIRLTDDFLAYQFSSFAASAGATIIMKYANDHYRVASELMKRPAHLESFYAKVPKWRMLLRKHDDPDWPPPSFIQDITDLIFTGNESLAFQLVDKVWLQDIPGKADFLKSYREALVDSIYYKEFKTHATIKGGG